MSLDALERGDTIVYAAGPRAYIALFDELGWLTWPAERGGWAKRKPGKESDVDTARELPPDVAALALRLSGVSQ